MAELLSYARAHVQPKRSFAPDAWLGAIVGSTTALANVVLGVAFADEASSGTPDKMWEGFALAAAEAAASALMGLLLVGGSIALASGSTAARRLHLVYGWGKLALTPVALVANFLLLDGVWETTEVRLSLCLITALGAIYPVFVLLGLRRARLEDVTAELA